MPEASGYKHDIFISYTHDDNSPIGISPGWVDTFHESLYNWLAKRRGFKKLTIWRDKKRMYGNTAFDADIEDALKSSALFFALHSNNYRNSAYCQKELRWFYEFNQHRPGGLLVGNSSRIFNILLNNIHYQNWPDPLQGTAGFKMNDGEGNEPGDFILRDDPMFIKRLRPIVDAVEDILNKFTPATPAETNGSTPHTCLLDTHQKDQRYAFKLADYLADKGIDVDFNMESHDPTISLTKFEQSLREVKNLVIIFDKVKPTWVEERIKKVIKTYTELVVNDETPVLQKVWVYKFPNGNIDLSKFATFSIITSLDNTHTATIDPQVVEQLLTPLSGSGGRL